MIIDSLSNLAYYKAMHPGIKKVLAFLAEHEFTHFDASYYEIDGKNIFAKITDEKLKTKDAARLESHRKYFDIQVPLTGEESYGWKKAETCQQPEGAFNEEKDIVFYKDKPDMYFSLQVNQFAIFFPGDAHAPLVGSETIKKLLFKILI